jgi:hypothetical protein
MAYQDPHFSKEAYWDFRNNSTPAQRSNLRRFMSKRGYGIAGQTAQVGGKPVSKKAMLKNTKRARKLQGV